MTGSRILRQVYHLMGEPERYIASDGNESGLLALNQICGELWKREHTEPFVPLDTPWQEVALPAVYLPAITYGTAALLCLNSGEERPYDRYLELYLRAVPRPVGRPYRRTDCLRGVEE